MGFKSSSVEPNFSESQGGRLGRLLPNKHNERTEQESEESIHTFDVSANIINEACSTEQLPTCEICSKYNIIMNLIQEAHNKCTKSIGTFTKEAERQTTSRKQWAVLVQSELDTGEGDSCSRGLWRGPDYLPVNVSQMLFLWSEVTGRRNHTVTTGHETSLIHRGSAYITGLR